jgi:ribosome-associated protein
MPARRPADVPIREESIRLGQFLKLAGLAAAGSDAKELISAGEVLVNGEPETRRGRQLRAGDVVELGGRAARVARPPGPAAVLADHPERRRLPGRSRPAGRALSAAQPAGLAIPVRRGERLCRSRSAQGAALILRPAGTGRSGRLPRHRWPKANSRLFGVRRGPVRTARWIRQSSRRQRHATQRIIMQLPTSAIRQIRTSVDRIQVHTDT